MVIFLRWRTAALLVVGGVLLAGAVLAVPSRRGGDLAAVCCEPAREGAGAGAGADGQGPSQVPVFGVETDQPVMSLAVNIDWGQEHLPAMLEILARHAVRVTFFPTGRWARQYPDLVRRLAETGHELGNHGSAHAHPKVLSDAQLDRLITDNHALLHELAGVRTTLFAPPYGEFDERVVRRAAAVGHWTILWTIDTIDWQRPPPETIAARVVERAQAGAIVLMHPTAPTVAALPRILEELSRRGYRLVPVGELLELGAPRTR